MPLVRVIRSLNCTFFLHIRDRAGAVRGSGVSARSLQPDVNALTAAVPYDGNAHECRVTRSAGLHVHRCAWCRDDT